MSAHRARQLYSSLLHLYPTGFRKEYARELTLLFTDMYRAAAAQGSRVLGRLWLAVLLDLASSAIRERMRTMTNLKLTSVPIQKWGGLALILLVVAFVASGLIYLTGNLRDAMGQFAYSLADFLAGPVWAISLMTAVLALREHIGDRAPRRMNLALVASFAAACVFVAIACIRSANRQYHLAHPELHLEQSVTVLVVWTTLVAGLTGAAWHFLGWSLLLIGSAGWSSARIPRPLSGVYLFAGTISLFVYLLPELEGLAFMLLLVISIWQGILLLRAEPQEEQAPKMDAGQSHQA